MPVTPDTPFCAYSAAKAITSTVVHMLVERGILSLDDRVCDYLPSYTSHGKDRTTIRHVMTHSAGVPFATGPRPNLDRMDDTEYARRKLGQLNTVSGAAGQLNETVPEGFADAHTTAWGAQAHLVLIDIDGPEAALTPISGLLDDGQLQDLLADSARLARRRAVHSDIARDRCAPGDDHIRPCCDEVGRCDEAVQAPATASI